MTKAENCPTPSLKKSPKVMAFRVSKSLTGTPKMLATFKDGTNNFLASCLYSYDVEKTEDGGVLTAMGVLTLPEPKPGSVVTRLVSGVPLPEPHDISKRDKHPQRT